MLLTGLLDTGLFSYGILIYSILIPSGFGGGDKYAKKDGVEEFQRVERLGMVVVVLSVRSAEALDRYLAANGVQTRAADLSAVKPYFGSEEYALVCAWAARAAEKVSARALRIDFPSPVVFYPLRPTRVYESEVRTAIFVRGLVRPAGRDSVAGVRCHYREGRIEEPGVAQGDKSRREPITRVELTGPPASWDQDLVLEPGAPAAVNAALFIADVPELCLWAAWAMLGAVLATFLPWAVLPKGTRHLTDWVWAAAVGASISLTVYASAVMFIAWRWRTVRRETPQARRPRAGIFQGAAVGLGLLLVAAQIGLFVELFAPLRDHDATVVVVYLGFVAVPCFFVSLILGAVWTEVPLRLGWFALFVALHWGIACGMLGALRAWIAPYG
jgi:hypothetical protein